SEYFPNLRTRSSAPLVFNSPRRSRTMLSSNVSAYTREPPISWSFLTRSARSRSGNLTSTSVAMLPGCHVAGAAETWQPGTPETLSPQTLTPRQGAPGNESEGRPPAGRDMADAVGVARRVDRLDRFSAADDGDRVGFGDRTGHRHG